MWQYDIKNNKAELIYPLYAVKSVCNSADGVLMLYPTTEWWSDGLINEKGKKLFNIYGAKIYKGRWVMNNTFSYPKEHKPTAPNIHTFIIYYSNLGLCSLG